MLSLTPVSFRTVGFAATLLVAAGAAAQDFVVEGVHVPCRDDVELWTELYHPARNGERLPGPFPVILMRTPYGAGSGRGAGQVLAREGYVLAAQDVRGRGRSQGTFYIYVNEGRDGFDTVEWLAEQPWCNGKVGTYGGSYMAATQNALAVERPAALAAMFVTVGTANYYHDGAARGGAFALLHNLTYAFSLGGLSAAHAALPEWLWKVPLGGDSPLRGAPDYLQWYTDWRAHPAYDDYWRQNGYCFEERYADFGDVPVYLVGGWYDIFKRGTLRNFAGLSRRDAPTKLLMGPWTHAVGGTRAGTVDFGAQAAVSILGEARRWFARHLKGERNGIDDEPPVRYFAMGRNAWQTSNTWPPAGAEPRRLYLHAGGALRREPPAAASEPSRFLYDPRDPVPTMGGNIDSGAHIVPRGAQQQSVQEGYFASPKRSGPLGARPDVLVFETDPLAQEVFVAGPLSATLWVSSDARDTDVTAKLVDVAPPSDDHPDGSAVNIEDGILRLRFRDGFEQERLMEPGMVYRVRVDLWGTAHVFRRGHRIRLDVSSSNFPLFDRNPNTGEPLGRHTRMVVARNAVHHEPEQPSSLDLSVLPASR